MQCFVSGRHKEVGDRDKQRAHERTQRDKRDAESKALEALSRALEKQHGRSRDSWLAADRDRLTAAERKYSEAALEFELAAVEQKDIDDSTADLKTSFQKIMERDKERRVLLIDNRDQSSVAVEVLARASTARAVALYLKVTPVKWLGPDKLAELEMRRGAEGTGYESAMIPEKDYGARSPYWIVSVWEFISGGGRWPGVADTAAELLAEVALGHLDISRHKDPKRTGQ